MTANPIKLSPKMSLVYLGDKKKKNLKTIVTIKFGPIRVATASLSLAWKEDQVWRELKKNPRAFTFEGDGEQILRANNLIL